MAGDLGSGGAQVDSATRAVIDFWFALSMERQFARDPALDREIAERFGALRQEVLDSRAAAWRGRADTVLAAVIVLDQFSRNLFRGQAEAFAADPLARELTLWALDHQWEEDLPPEQRMFLYMPLMHAEDAALQDLSVRRFEGLGRDDVLDHAVQHRDAIARFGRFPSRNAALGRDTTPDEQAWLDAGGGW